MEKCLMIWRRHCTNLIMMPEVDAACVVFLSVDEVFKDARISAAVPVAPIF